MGGQRPVVPRSSVESRPNRALNMANIYEIIPINDSPEPPHDAKSSRRFESSRTLNSGQIQLRFSRARMIHTRSRQPGRDGVPEQESLIFRPKMKSQGSRHRCCRQNTSAAAAMVHNLASASANTTRPFRYRVSNSWPELAQT